MPRAAALVGALVVLSCHGAGRPAKKPPPPKCQPPAATRANSNATAFARDAACVVRRSRRAGHVNGAFTNLVVHDACVRGDEPTVELPPKVDARRVQAQYDQCTCQQVGHPNAKFVARARNHTPAWDEDSIVVWTSSKHMIGYYEEVVLMMNIYASVLEARKRAVANGMVTLDAGEDVGDILHSKHLVHVYVQRQPGAEVNKPGGIADFRAFEHELFATQPVGWIHDVTRATREEQRCAHMVVVGTFDELRHITYADRGGNPHKNINYSPELFEPYFKFRRNILRAARLDAMRTALGGRAARKAPNRTLRVLFLDRSKQEGAGKESRTITNTRALAAYARAHSDGLVEVVAADFGSGSGLWEQVNFTHGFDAIAGPEGAGFSNQLWLPLNAGLLVVHGLKELSPKAKSKTPQVLQWHTAMAQYFGHSVVGYLTKSRSLNERAFLNACLALRKRMLATAHRGPAAAFSQCVTQDGPTEHAGGCAQWSEDTCPDRAEDDARPPAQAVCKRTGASAATAHAASFPPGGWVR